MTRVILRKVQQLLLNEAIQTPEFIDVIRVWMPRTMCHPFGIHVSTQFRNRRFQRSAFGDKVVILAMERIDLCLELGNFAIPLLIQRLEVGA